MAFRGETGHTGPTEWNTTGPLCKGVPIRAIFGSPLMAFRGETGHTGPTEGNTTAPLCKGVPIRAIFGSPLMAFRGVTGHTGPTEGNTTAPLCKGVPIRPVFGSPLMAIRGETGHTGPTEGNTTAPLCTIRKCGKLLTFASCCIWKSIYESHTAGSGKDENRQQETCTATLWCGQGDSNPHALRHQILSLAWLPITTRPQS